MSSYGHAYLTSYGWTGTGTGLRNGAVARPLAIPPKKSLSGLGKDRDEAFPFWDHLFAAASKAITISASSADPEDANDAKDPSQRDELRRTTTGIISNRRPISGTPVSPSGSATPSVPDSTGDAGTLSLLAAAKREAAKRGLYSRFFRGPVLGPREDAPTNMPSDVGPSSTAPPTPVHAPPVDKVAGETRKSKKRKSEGVETKEERRERKRLKKERKAARIVRKMEETLARKAAKQGKRLGVLHWEDQEMRTEENGVSRMVCRQAQKSLVGGLQLKEDRVVLATQRKKGKWKDTQP